MHPDTIVEFGMYRGHTLREVRLSYLLYMVSKGGFRANAPGIAHGFLVEIRRRLDADFADAWRDLAKPDAKFRSPPQAAHAPRSRFRVYSASEMVERDTSSGPPRATTYPPNVLDLA